MIEQNEGDCQVPNCLGKYILGEVENCSCHINPPCSECTNNPITCNECGHEMDDVIPKWTMREYFGKDDGRWTITDGKIQFDIHPLVDGSNKKDLYPDGIIVSREESTEYAKFILDTLNKASAKEIK